MQSIAKKPAETATNKKLLEMKQRALKSPGRWGAALDATLQISYKWVSLPKLRFCGTTSFGEIS